MPRVINEVTMAVLGFRIPLIGVYVGWGCWKKEGEPASVSFDVKKILKYRKRLLGFWHTHPNMLNYPSSVDVPTMYTWCNTVGKPLFCMIEGIDGDTYTEEHKEAIANWLFTTYPMDNREDRKEYVGYAHRLGRLFIWRKET